MCIAPSVVRSALLLTLASSLAAQAGWTRLYPASSPSPRASASMAFDSARGVMVLFGGIAAGDVWQWNGTSWSSLPPGPPARYDASMAFDSARGRVVLFGGYVLNVGNPGADTWEWDGTSWLLRTPVHAPDPRTLVAMAFDPTRSLAGLHAFEQAAVLDSAAPGGVALTNAGELVIGIR